jgi:hypothetical protein
MPDTISGEAAVRERRLANLRGEQAMQIVVVA